MSAPLKNIIIAGATGSVGAPILAALLAEPSFNITILTRASSSAKFPDGIPVKQVSDGYTVSELTEAFKGQDAVVVALSTTPVTKEGKNGLAYRLIDAAVGAGVKRFIPSEFGANNLSQRSRSTVPVYNAKGENLLYLIEKANQSNGALTWTSISCGSWLDWGLDPAKSGNFLGVDVKNRKATIWDSGRSRFTVTSSTNTGIGVAKALLNHELTANKQVFLSDFVTNVWEIVEKLEKETGEKFAIEQKKSAPEIKALWEKFKAGDYMATFPLLALSFVADMDVGYDFEKEEQVWNDKLGLPKVRIEEIVRGAVELAAKS